MTLFYSPSRKSFSLIALFLLFFCGVFFGGIKESRAACTVTSWTPYVSTVCSGTSFTQTSNCGTTRSATGTMIGTWSPAPSTVCSGTSYTQTSSCGLTQTNTGTKCCDTSWSPATSGTCSDTTLTQTSNCSNTRTVSGTLNCLVNGSCGAAATTYAYNASGYSGAACSTGTGSLPAFPAAGSSASWTCSGAHGGSSPSCTATRNPTPVNGSCGAAATTYAYNASGYSGAACSTGTGSLPAFPAAGSSSTWTCAGSNGGSSSGTCTATRNPTPVNGSCGTGATTYAYNATAYTGSACATGSGSFPAFPSAGSSSTWTCSGLNGGSSSGTCTATRNPTPVNGLCGAAATNYTSGTSAFSGSACSVGSGSLPVFPSAGSSASWSCTGSNGGSTASCTATRDPYVCGGSVPLNGTAYNGTNLTGLTVPTNYSYANPNTVAKCEFSCNAGYDWDGSSCVAPPTINTFSATPSSISPGGSTTLTWDTTGVVTSGCTASGGTWSGTKAKTNLTGNTVSGINTTTTYTISCVNSAGVPASASVTVTVVPNPTVSLTAAPTTVIQGSSTLLTWSSTNAVYPCVSTGGWTGSSRVVNNSTGVSSVVTANTTYTLTCSNSIGVSASDSATVTALVPVNGVCGSANKTYTSGVTSFGSDIACSSGTGSLPIFPAAGSTATWACSGINTGTNASCTVSRDPYVCSGTVPSHATAYTGTNLTGLTTPVGYTYANPNTVAKCEFSCNAGYDWDGSSCVAPPTINTFSATPSSISPGGSTTLTWDTTGVVTSGCTASGGTWSGTKAKTNLTGNTVSGINTTTTYTISCVNSAGVPASASVTVTVVPNPTVSLTAAPTTVIQGSSTLLTWSSTNAVYPCVSTGGWTGSSRVVNNSTGVSSVVTANTTYTLTCSNSIGVSASDSATVTALVPVNGVCGSANKTYTSGVTSFGSDIACSSGTGSLPIFPAAGSTATWACSGINTGTNASCTVSRDPYVCSGTVPSHATAYTGTNLTGLTTPVGYTYANPNTVAKCEFSCNAGYDWDGVSCVPPPTVTLTATPVSIATGTNTLLTWSSTNTIGSCTASGGWAGSSRALNNSTGANPGTITADTTYTLTCHNSANVTASDSVTVTAVPNPTVTLTATPTAVIIGNSPTLTWSSTNTVSPCISSGSTAWNSPSRSRSNSTGVAPGGITTSTTYTMTCSNSVGVSASDSVTVTILPNTAQPPIITDLSGNGSPITISKGQSTGFRFHSAPDVEGNNVYYEVDWDNDGVSDGITPTSGYVTPATIQETAHTWATSGSYTFKVRTKDNSATDPAVSEWVPFTVNVAVFAICPFAVTVGVGEAGIQAVGWYGIGAKCSSHPGAIDVTMTANWTSSATGIATVTNTITDKGWVVGKNVGIATITSTYLGQTDTIAVTSVVNGQCSTSVKNSCIRGVFFDTTDSMANYIWMCNGSGG